MSISCQPKYAQYKYNCANCGGGGHMYKSCNHPITSYGIICYRLNYDQQLQCVYPEYLMVQRKDSLSYVEFIRGKYNIENSSYIIKLFSNMTEDERFYILNKPFDILWKNLWQIDNTTPFQKEYTEAKRKFLILYNGYIIRCGNVEYSCDIHYIINQSKSILTENEWGFPKGRRNINEKDICCAIREFVEEAGVEFKYININLDQKPYEEIFNGSNKIRYRHIYYLANMPLINNNIDLKPKKNNKIQSLEIKDVKWFKYSDAQDKILEYNTERKELLKRVNYIIIKKIATNHTYNI